MSSADLLASMKALDLGLSPDSEANPVESERTKVSKPKPRKDSRLVDQANESSATPPKRQDKLEVEKPIPSVAQEANRGALPAQQSSNKKSKPRHHKKRSNETQT